MDEKKKISLNEFKIFQYDRIFLWIYLHRDGVKAVQECKLHRQFEDFHRHPSFDFAIRRDEENAKSPFLRLKM